VLHKEIPFLRIGLPLCAGIITGLYIKPDITFLVIVVIISISGLLISLLFNRHPVNHFYGLALTGSLFICGLILYTNEKTSISTLRPEKTVFTGTLSDFPEEKENSIRLTVKLNRKSDSYNSESVKGSIILFLFTEN